MADTSDLDKKQLEEAFETFSRVSAELDASYQVLQQRIGTLTQELSEARSQRLRDLAEKERLANRLALLMDALPGGVVVVDSAGVIREANPAATEFLGGQPLPPRRWQDVLKATVADELPSESELVLNSGRRLSVNTRYLESGDEQVILLTDMTRLYELKEANAREQRLVALGEMAARLAHQVRTPLSSALLYSGHLAAPGLSDDKRIDKARKVAAGLRHMESLVDSMLNFVRGTPFAWQVIEVADLARELTAAADSAVAARGARCQVSLDLPEAPGFIRGDRDALVGAVLNLVDNAVETSGKETDVALAITVRRDRLAITVSDRGEGMTPELCEKVFDPFFTTRENGTGIGLAVVATTARSHGGNVAVHSAPGVGSTFTIDLPLQASVKAASEVFAAATLSPDVEADFAEDRLQQTWKAVGGVSR